MRRKYFCLLRDDNQRREAEEDADARGNSKLRASDVTHRGVPPILENKCPSDIEPGCPRAAGCAPTRLIEGHQPNASVTRLGLSEQSHTRSCASTSFGYSDFEIWGSVERTAGTEDRSGRVFRNHLGERVAYDFAQGISALGLALSRSQMQICIFLLLSCSLRNKDCQSFIAVGGRPDVSSKNKHSPDS